MADKTTPHMLREQDSLQRRIDAAEDEDIPDGKSDTTEARRALALRICRQTADAGAPPRCEEPCAWCMNEAREEMEGQVNAG